MNMNVTAILAASGALLVVAAAVSFFLGRGQGTRSELTRQTAAKSSAEQSSSRIIADAEREADALKKGAILTGKEEVIRVREAWEIEARRRREEVEKEEKRVQERENALDRKFELVDTREKEAAKR